MIALFSTNCNNGKEVVFIKRTKDSYYLGCFEEYEQIIFTPLKSDALQLPKNIAERYVQKLKEIDFDEYIINPAKDIK